MTHGVRTPFCAVNASVRLIELCRTEASVLGLNASVSATQTPLLPRGKAATACDPAIASDGESIELLSSVEIFVQPAAAWARPGEPPIAIVAASTSTDRDLRIPAPFLDRAFCTCRHCVRVRRALRAARRCRACAPSPC